ncbi:MAG: phosphotransferase, partial [Planctomycetales bacterium]|nr:phosphotransferase [Planctomycetales bacterium]
MYTYRELRSGWAIAAKFYGVKTNRADKYALQEFDGIVKAREMGLSAGPIRAVRPLGHWGSVLFLEQVDGPTLEDVISVRHSSPGLLRAAVEAVSRLLARLHGNSAYPARRSQFEPSAAYAYKVVDDLSNHGVLWQDSVLQDALFRLIKRWATHPNMMRFVPSLIHGDVTTSNLIFPDGRTGVVAIDWERSQRGDPAEDLGRFLAEVTHSLSQHGGTAAEARSLIEHILGSYTQALPGGPDPEM